MTYNAGSRLVTSVEGAVVSTYTFDANGNQTAVNAGGTRTTYAYDYENRMRTAIDPGGARSTIAYWADGMRRFLEVAGTRTTFVWDGSDYLQSRTPSDVTTFSTVDAQILDSETGGSESLLVPDPLGSVVKVLDASGNQLYDAWYWAYGETRLSVGVNNTPWGYGGTWGYHFDTSGRLYIRARVLDPVTGRWYSVDPLWPEQPSFVYVSNLPTTDRDPSGMNPDSGLWQGLRDWLRWPPTLVPPGQGLKGKPGGGGGGGGGSTGCQLDGFEATALSCLSPDCVKNTQEYYARYKKHGGKLDACASCVSKAICYAISGGSVGGIATSVLADQSRCQNNCMIEYWRTRSTPKWKRAAAVCAMYGESSKDCCEASVSAEQDGYTRCAQICFPAISVIPAPIREAFATKVLKCCG